VNTFDRLRMEVRGLVARVAALEAARSPRRKRATAPRPDDAAVMEIHKLWARYLELEMQFGHGRMKLSKLAFAIKWHLNPDEFVRAFSFTDTHGIPQGSVPDQNHRRALAGAMSELEARGENQLDGIRLNSHGSIRVSQDSGGRPQ
jgi:hypothetical protein